MGKAFQHPMQRHMGQSSGPRFGCTFLIILIGLLAGAIFFIANTYPSAESRHANDALARLSTYEAALHGTATPEPLSVALDDETAPEEQPTLVPTPENLELELATQRKIFFPSAGTSGRIVTVRRMAGGWDVAYLQDLVGHLEGTSWLGDTGNTVLAGHFEDQIGRPGPFRYLYNAQVGDTIIIQDGDDAPLVTYQVTEVFRTDPSDVEVLRHTDSPRITLITCDSWSQSSYTYEERLVVIAEPVSILASLPDEGNLMDGVN